jgi:PAS domain S-box-containing protein
MARLALSESEEKFRFMAETMPQLIFTTNADGQLTYLNGRWETYTGIPLKNLLHNGWKDIIHPEDLPVMEARWEKALHNLEDYQAEMRKKHKDGQYRWHLCRALPMLDENKKVVMWVGNCTDIHDTRQMVEELLTSNEEMARLADQVQRAYAKAESERKTLERLIMRAPAFFCILKGPEHRYELVNDNYQKLFPNRELLHKTVAEAVPEVVEQGFVAVLDNVYETGKDYLADKITVKLDQHNTGTLEDVILSFIYQPLVDENNVVYGILVCGFEVPKND